MILEATFDRTRFVGREPRLFLEALQARGFRVRLPFDVMTDRDGQTLTVRQETPSDNVTDTGAGRIEHRRVEAGEVRVFTPWGRL